MVTFTLGVPFSHNTYVAAVAAPAIDKVGPRPYHFRPGPTSGPTTRPQEAKKVKLKSPIKFPICLSHDIDNERDHSRTMTTL